MQLFSTKNNPSQKFIRLSHLRTQREAKAAELARMDAEISTLEAELNQFLGNSAPQSTSTQTVATTQVKPSVPKRINNHEQVPVPTTNTNVKPAINAAAPAAINQNAVQSRLAPSTPKAAPSNAPRSSSAGIPGMVDIVNDRAPYHTERLQIQGVQPLGQIVMHKHYLAGDGISYGIPALEGCNVTVHQSGNGKMYRLMETPAVRITCTLVQPLPADIRERSQIIKDWLAANNWMTSQDPAKTVFETEYDQFGNEYSPYVSVDTKGMQLYIYIGCASMTSAKPCPTLIA